MPRHKTYTQCKLSRPTDVGREIMVSWIQSDLAKKGLVIDLRPDNGDWTRGWRVDEIGSTKSGEQVEAAVPDYRHQRKMSDV